MQVIEVNFKFYLGVVMKEMNIKQILGLMLASTILLSTAGCNKPAPKDVAKTDSAASAAKNGSAPKIYQEGVDAYQSGKFSVAADKFRLLAEQGDASAQFNLGSLYRQGQGVPQDDKQAALWWAKAADQGHTDAQDNLGLRYAKGEGVEQDMVQAYKWFSIAGMRKNASAAANAKIMASKMTPDKIEEAQNLAKDWMAQHPK
jgi:TPR repeat protein